MRVLWFIIGIVLTFGFLGFLVNNFDTRVPVTVLSTQHVGVPLWRSTTCAPSPAPRKT